MPDEIFGPFYSQGNTAYDADRYTDSDLTYVYAWDNIVDIHRFRCFIDSRGFLVNAEPRHSVWLRNYKHRVASSHSLTDRQLADRIELPATNAAPAGRPPSKRNQAKRDKQVAISVLKLIANNAAPKDLKNAENYQNWI